MKTRSRWPRRRASDPASASVDEREEAVGAADDERPVRPEGRRVRRVGRRRRAGDGPPAIAQVAGGSASRVDDAHGAVLPRCIASVRPSRLTAVARNRSTGRPPASNGRPRRRSPARSQVMTVPSAAAV